MAHSASDTMGTGDCFRGVKWQEHEADKSCPSSAEFKIGEPIHLLISDLFIHLFTFHGSIHGWKTSRYRNSQDNRTNPINYMNKN
jgi:hypothetical protein